MQRSLQGQVNVLEFVVVRQNVVQVVASVRAPMTKLAPAFPYFRKAGRSNLQIRDVHVNQLRRHQLRDGILDLDALN
jgi:hypothetical protein